MGRKELKYETWTPDVKGLSNTDAPLRVHSWFDFKRNVMVVEVTADPACAATPGAETKGTR